eukprot:GEMP01118156.1.p1 GENE.GEMP01118156.1~~GEMP01118156.1.p1  ORF type:complete len:169 (+),score=25.16 GEMP01118156.1:60-566(+)
MRPYILLVTTLSAVPTRQVLDLGFKSLQESLVANSTEPLAHWPPGQNIQKPFQTALTAALSTDLQALKKHIGQTWVELPPDRRKIFERKLKAHIVKLFADTTLSMQSRLQRRVEMWKQFPPKSFGLGALSAVFKDSLQRFESRLNDYYELEARTAPLLAQSVSLVEVV